MLVQLTNPDWKGILNSRKVSSQFGSIFLWGWNVGNSRHHICKAFNIFIFRAVITENKPKIFYWWFELDGEFWFSEGIIWNIKQGCCFLIYVCGFRLTSKPGFSDYSHFVYCVVLYFSTSIFINFIFLLIEVKMFSNEIIFDNFFCILHVLLFYASFCDTYKVLWQFWKSFQKVLT